MCKNISFGVYLWPDIEKNIRRHIHSSRTDVACGLLREIFIYSVSNDVFGDSSAIELYLNTTSIAVSACMNRNTIRNIHHDTFIFMANPRRYSFIAITDTGIEIMKPARTIKKYGLFPSQSTSVYSAPNTLRMAISFLLC